MFYFQMFYIRHIRWHYVLLAFSLVFFGACAQKPMEIGFEASRPAAVQIDPAIQKIFIDPANINVGGDKLGLTPQLLNQLIYEINQLGRFQAVLGPPTGFDANQEQVLILQGVIGSDFFANQSSLVEEVVCFGGTFTLQLNNCTLKKGTFTFTYSLDSSAGITTVGALINTNYSTYSLYLQADFSLTVTGADTRQIVRLNLDADNNSMHKGEPKYVKRADQLSLAMAFTAVILPVSGVQPRAIAISDEAVPEDPLPTLNLAGFKTTYPKEYSETIRDLLSKNSKPLVEMISPHQKMVTVVIADSGDSKAVDILRQGDYQQAKDYLEDLDSKAPADYYNLGLAFEALQDYPNALRNYRTAFEEVVIGDYAVSIARVENQLKIERGSK